MRTLVAIPVYNEQDHVDNVLREVSHYASDILVIDDGSTDRTPSLLANLPVDVIRHSTNRGYGRSIRDAFRWTQCYEYDWLITMDCDEQHEPRSLPGFFEAIEQGHADIISGSRYLEACCCDDQPPPDRREINMTVTGWINKRLGLKITDAFCGFKALRVDAIRQFDIDENGYAIPLQFWVQVAALELRVTEVPIRLVYNNPNRSFGGPLDDPARRLEHYRSVFESELRKYAVTGGPAGETVRTEAGRSTLLGGTAGSP